MAEYKVTALQDVTIRAYVRFQRTERLGNALANRPDESLQWVSLRAGEVREGLGLVMGVDPESTPDQMPINWDGVEIVMPPGWSNDELPKEFFGAYRLELHSI